jgi:hypothetical protein
MEETTVIPVCGVADMFADRQGREVGEACDTSYCGLSKQGRDFLEQRPPTTDA